MKCGFCGYEFEEHDGKQGCGSCPGGCHAIHCPRCNYKNPQVTSLEKRIKTFIDRRRKAPLDDPLNTDGASRPHDKESP